MFTFSAYLIPFWLKIMLGRGFIIFWIFLLFFSKFSCPSLVWTELGNKFFFFLFSGLSHPVFGKNNVRKRFYNFLNFFTISFGIFFPGSSMNGILEWNFVFTFPANLIPFWLKIMPGGGFIIFWFFLEFFTDFSCPGRVWTEFCSEILFSLFRSISSRFGKK